MPDAEVNSALTRAFHGLNPHERLVVPVLTSDGLSCFELTRTVAGIPRARVGEPATWDRLSEEAEIIRAARAAHAGPMVIVRTAIGVAISTASQLLETLHVGAETLDAIGATLGDVEDVIHTVLGDDPLQHLHELVVLRRLADDRLEVDTVPLFPKEAVRGAQADLVLSGPDGGGDVVFAVMSQIAGRWRVLSLQTASLGTGSHHVVVQLTGPGRIQLVDPEVPLTVERRPWREVLATVPTRHVPPPPPTHLVCAVEVSGPAEAVSDRISRVGQLLTLLRNDPTGGGARISLIAYGPHVHDDREGPSDTGPEVLAWDEDVQYAQAELAYLAETGSRPLGYRNAAQLECVLDEVVHRIEHGSVGGSIRPTVLLVVGDRPAYPPRTTAGHNLICPAKISWVQKLNRLRDQGLRFAAVCDRNPEEVEAIWHRLGDGEPESLDAVDVRPLGRRLGLLRPRQRSAHFPVIFDSQ